MSKVNDPRDRATQESESEASLTNASSESDSDSRLEATAVSNSESDTPSRPDQVSPFLLGMLAGLVLIILGGLGALLVVIFVKPFKTFHLPWVDASLGSQESDRIPATRAQGLPLSSRHSKSTNPNSQGRLADDQLSLSCLSRQPELRALADPSNYGPRLPADWTGRPVANRPSLIVLHETVVDESTALALFRSPNNSDARQASYHVLIGRDGRRIRVVPDSERAYGAGDSDFSGMAVQLKPGLPPSLNNIALHVSLVSPPDGGDGERRQHSGYTDEQYRSLASQIAQWKLLYGIGPGFVVTHQEVDRSGSRRDPRSFSWAQLSNDLGSRWLACGGSPMPSDLGRSSGRSAGL